MSSSSEWMVDAQAIFSRIHSGMNEILRSTTEPNPDSAKASVDAYLNEVCKLRELLVVRINEMKTWKKHGNFKVENLTIDRLNLTR